MQSAWKYAVALPTSRVTILRYSLAFPIALLDSAAWYPFIRKNGAWLSIMCDESWWACGFRPRQSKDYLLFPTFSCLEIRIWEVTAAKLLWQLVTAFRSFFLNALAELRRECTSVHSTWLFGVLLFPVCVVSFGTSGFDARVHLHQ